MGWGGFSLTMDNLQGDTGLISAPLLITCTVCLDRRRCLKPGPTSESIGSAVKVGTSKNSLEVIHKNTTLFLSLPSESFSYQRLIEKDPPDVARKIFTHLFMSVSNYRSLLFAY